MSEKCWMQVRSRRTIMIGATALVLSGGLYVIALNSHAAQAEFVRQQRDRVTKESHAYCEKWGFLAGTDEYRGCIADLRDIRKREARRVLDEDLGSSGL